jgi:hypothetical protein
VVELDYGDQAIQFSDQGSYVALLAVQEFPSPDPRVDALILRTLPPQKDGNDIILERLGVLKLSYHTQLSSPSLLEARRQKKRSLRYRLTPGSGPRK